MSCEGYVPLVFEKKIPLLGKVIRKQAFNSVTNVTNMCEVRELELMRIDLLLT